MNLATAMYTIHVYYNSYTRDVQWSYNISTTSITFDLIISFYGASETLENPPKSASHNRKKNPRDIFILDDIKLYTLDRY